MDITRQREPSQISGRCPPVSTQNRRDVHDTAPEFSMLDRKLNLHCDPFQIPTNARDRRELLGNTDPVAAQKCTDPHDTSENRLGPPRSGVGCTDHLSPFQRSASALPDPGLELP